MNSFYFREFKTNYKFLKWFFLFQKPKKFLLNPYFNFLLIFLRFYIFYILDFMIKF